MVYAPGLQYAPGGAVTTAAGGGGGGGSAAAAAGRPGSFVGNCER